ncbi:glucosyl-3-phosphoglycerate synthase [Corynebacterium sp. sy017]|uniref:glucosyl-3-phosphoglycerate synthase n=1 Tax=unclassified Corynebacterium TaxID=2624378 RepID=UPI0011851C6E|nr:MULTISPECIES: glucosyl-3-phosphoglycerate synthase [unclassified Corynebacterium]MBP3088958.1 glucosyl-3-phosphoglycerate synthase [Corynebacterium sp. sy017]QDZ42331.1 glucosyl-3-phosphoglycerate synthase [Corynebacterium sp. sy039]TSD91283.1 glucosyl-3-phosphoglycerate synthase [Corynebacterium sp. SY003]
MKLSIVIPALNEEKTIAQVIVCVQESIAASSFAQSDVELLVIDADSTDNTYHEAAATGACVLNWREIIPHIPPRTGKGESLWRGVYAARGEIVMFIDADLETVDPMIVSKLTAPFSNPQIHLVKADYRRAFQGQPTGGGRVTQLSAKPLLRAFFPELASINQPLAGEYAIRRSTALSLAFVEGYGVEIGLLIDIYRRYGITAIAQAQLVDKYHRNRTLTELSAMSDIVIATILDRVGIVNELGINQRMPIDAISSQANLGEGK